MELTNIGSFNLEKGLIREGHKLFAWDGVQDCNEDSCVVVNKCNYIHKGKCAVHTKYLATLCDTICSTYKYLDEMQYFKIGMHIIPLYSHLLRLKLVEMSLTTIACENNKGMKFIHPVYKEIRQTLGTIHLMWKDLGMNPGIPDIPNPSNNDTTINGDPNYYDSLAKMDSVSSGKRKIR